MRRVIIATAAVAALAALGAAPAYASRLAPAGAGQAARPSAHLGTRVSVSGFHLVHVPQVKRIVLTRPDTAATERSVNWSGYADLPKHGHKFKAVSANFTVPAVNCTDSTNGTGDLSSMSNWVGLDGFGDSTVEQTGEAVICDGTTNEYGYLVFWETYPAPANTFCCTDPGDAIHVSVTFNPKTDLYHLYLIDYTLNDTLSEFEACESGSTCDNASAEVIGEDLDGGAPYSNLAFFGQTSFVNASVTSSNGKSGSLSASKYWNSDKIIMQYKKSVMATPSSLYGGRAYLDTWHAGD